MVEVWGQEGQAATKGPLDQDKPQESWKRPNSLDLCHREGVFRGRGGWGMLRVTGEGLGFYSQSNEEPWGEVIQML